MPRLSLFIVLILALSILGSAAAQQTAATSEELQFVELLNAEREKHGLHPLTLDTTLIEIARKHSREMAEKKYFSHTSPTPGLKSPMDRYLTHVRRRPSWALVGENLYYCSIVDVKRGHVALMNSPSHRANILDNRFDSIGVGAFVDDRGQFFVTQTYLAKTD